MSENKHGVDYQEDNTKREAQLTVLKTEYSALKHAKYGDLGTRYSELPQGIPTQRSKWPDPRIQQAITAAMGLRKGDPPMVQQNVSGNSH